MRHQHHPITTQPGTLDRSGTSGGEGTMTPPLPTLSPPAVPRPQRYTGRPTRQSPRHPHPTRRSHQSTDDPASALGATSVGAGVPRPTAGVSRCPPRPQPPPVVAPTPG